MSSSLGTVIGFYGAMRDFAITREHELCSCHRPVSDTNTVHIPLHWHWKSCVTRQPLPHQSHQICSNVEPVTSPGDKYPFAINSTLVKDVLESFHPNLQLLFITAAEFSFLAEQWIKYRGNSSKNFSSSPRTI
mgnify:CR=1 FL=1